MVKFKVRLTGAVIRLRPRWFAGAGGALMMVERMTVSFERRCWTGCKREVGPSECTLATDGEGHRGGDCYAWDGGGHVVFES